MFRSFGAPTPVAMNAEKPVVLLVEKNEAYRSAVAERLQTAGFVVIEAADSAEAELVLKNTPVDALVHL